MVLQDAHQLARRFNAKVQTESYLELFLRRLSGEKIMMNKAMEAQFFTSELSPEELRIKKAIEDWRYSENSRLESELFKQKERLVKAEKTLISKTTKKALEEQRIASSKIEKLKADIKRVNTFEAKSESSHRIYPFHYLSMLSLDDRGEKVIRPFRYHMRPHNKDESFDHDFGGCYNARFDSLKRVAFWNDSLASRRGIILVRKFYENVPLDNYLKKNRLPEGFQKSSNLVVCFAPEEFEFMVIPTLWDSWQKNGAKLLYSMALITDEPAPEVAAAGHDRTPIFLSEKSVEKWLHATSIDQALEALQDRETPFYSHDLVTAV